MDEMITGCPLKHKFVIPNVQDLNNDWEVRRVFLHRVPEFPRRGPEMFTHIRITLSHLAIVIRDHTRTRFLGASLIGLEYSYIISPVSGAKSF